MAVELLPDALWDEIEPLLPPPPLRRIDFGERRRAPYVQLTTFR